jgi:hypothetical protein
MTSEMNILLDRLQQAIDDAISDSDRISGIVDEMKRSGYDLCLVVQSSAAVSPIEGISPIEAVSPIDDPQFPDFVPEPRLVANVPASNGQIELTSEDLAFLQEMKIAA